MGPTRTTISYDEKVEQRIQKLMGAGVVESRSDFFQRAASAYFMLMDLSREASEVDVALEEGTDEAAELVAAIEEASSGGF